MRELLLIILRVFWLNSQKIKLRGDKIAAARLWPEIIFGLGMWTEPVQWPGFSGELCERLPVGDLDRNLLCGTSPQLWKQLLLQDRSARLHSLTGGTVVSVQKLPSPSLCIKRGFSSSLSNPLKVITPSLFVTVLILGTHGVGGSVCISPPKLLGFGGGCSYFWLCSNTCHPLQKSLDKIDFSVLAS